MPFIFRLSGAYEIIRAQTRETDLDHASFRFVAGPPSRYIASGNGRMLEPEVAGVVR